MSGGNPLGTSGLSTSFNNKQSYPNTSGGKNQAFVSLGIKQLTTSIPPNTTDWVVKSYKSSAGNVNTITPSYSSYSIYVPQNLYVDGTIFGNLVGTVTAPSDIVLKENITDLGLTIDLNKIMELNPKSYTYKKDKKDKKIHYGLIAQEMELVYPDLVYNDKGNKTINYVELIPLLILKIKDVQNQIDDLKNKIL
jgi:Chaperone of endosialidase